MTKHLMKINKESLNIFVKEILLKSSNSDKPPFG